MSKRRRFQPNHKGSTVQTCIFPVSSTRKWLKLDDPYSLGPQSPSQSHREAILASFVVLNFGFSNFGARFVGETPIEKPFLASFVEVSGLEPRKLSSSSSTASSFDHDDYKPGAPLVRRYSISATSALSQSELSNHSVTSKLQKLKDQVKEVRYNISFGQLAREDNLELRQEASELHEYSNAKLERVTRYLGVLANKTRKLDQFALETEARISPLINEKRRLFNDLLTAKGHIKIYCCARPLFEDEGSSIVEYPDDYNILVSTGDDALSNPKKDFELDRVYGPHVGQAELFCDVQPLVQSALDGYNVSIFAYGQTNSGKTHTMVALFSSFPPSAFVCVCLCRNVYLMHINLYLYADFYSSSQFKAL
ncbi:kinesin-like protein KIN-14A [Prunus avium]|uniref:Kinesin-like protein KIN-14A n=1 Tax=Prunus avium TaxID=42229 RepID=A0A6P5SHH5_PRUAV|nr:kinesin-like protein KIN-14A [Prunus avium]